MNNNLDSVRSNPFAMMLAPQDVLAAVEESAALRKLRQKQYLLLDRPAIEAATGAVQAAHEEPEDDDFDVDALFDGPLMSESVSGSHTYQSFPRVFD